MMSSIAPAPHRLRQRLDRPLRVLAILNTTQVFAEIVLNILRKILVLTLSSGTHKRKLSQRSTYKRNAGIVDGMHAGERGI